MDPAAGDRRQAARYSPGGGGVHDEQGGGVRGEAHGARGHRRRPVGRVEQGAVQSSMAEGPASEQADDGLRAAALTEAKGGLEREPAGGRGAPPAQLGAAGQGQAPSEPQSRRGQSGAGARRARRARSGDPPHPRGGAKPSARGRTALERGRGGARRAAGSRAAFPVTTFEGQEMVGCRPVGRPSGRRRSCSRSSRPAWRGRGWPPSARTPGLLGRRGIQVVQHHARAHARDPRASGSISRPRSAEPSTTQPSPCLARQALSRLPVSGTPLSRQAGDARAPRSPAGGAEAREGQPAVEAGVACVELARGRVVAHLAGRGAAQCGDQSRPVHARDGTV